MTRGVTLGIGLALGVLATGAATYGTLRSARLPTAAHTGGVALAECGRHERDARGACYAAAFSRRLAAAGPGEALAMLEATAAVDPDVNRDGHVYAHGIGIEAYERDTVVARTLPRCSLLFSSGCYHGVIQAYLESRSAVDRVTLAELCRPFRGELSRWILFQCVHGMGHGLTMFYGHDLPRALVDCDLMQEYWDRESCYGGAFMENVMHATMPDHPASRLASHRHQSSFKPIDAADLHYPCSRLDPRYTQSCYLMQTSVMLHFTRGDIGKAAKACDGARPDARSTCYQSLGRDITSYTLRDPDASRRECLRGSDAMRASCFGGVVKALVDWSAKASSGHDFCSRLDAGPARGACYFALGEEVAGLARTMEERAELCRPAPDALDLRSCRRGAQL